MAVVSKIRVKSKNLFDKDNADKRKWYLNNGTPASSTAFNSIIIPCESSTEYTAQKFVSTTSPFGVAFYDSYPEVSSVSTNYSRAGSIDKITLKSTANSKYMVCEYLYDTSGDETTIQSLLNSLVISKGIGVEDYVPYYIEINKINNTNISKITFNGVEYE